MPSTVIFEPPRRVFLEGGIERADDITAETAGGVFATEEQNAVRPFLSEGPGKATFEGR
jgi:hypothetical protein